MNRLPNIPPPVNNGPQQQQQHQQQVQQRTGGQQQQQQQHGIQHQNNVSAFIGEKMAQLPQPPSNMGPPRDDGSSGYGSPDSETLETIPTAQ